jgi:hypothetical protein
VTHSVENGFSNYDDPAAERRSAGELLQSAITNSMQEKRFPRELTSRLSSALISTDLADRHLHALRHSLEGTSVALVTNLVDALEVYPENQEVLEGWVSFIEEATNSAHDPLGGLWGKGKNDLIR